MKKEKTIGGIAFKTSAIVATAISLYYIVTLDNVDNFWQYAICFACLVYLIIILCTKWDAIMKFVEEEERNTEICDIEDYK